MRSLINVIVGLGSLLVHVIVILGSLLINVIIFGLLTINVIIVGLLTINVIIVGLLINIIIIIPSHPTRKVVAVTDVVRTAVFYSGFSDAFPTCLAR